MDRQGTKNVTHFCKLGNDKHHLHNQEAPNRMNRLCGGKSSWDIMLAHPDFKNDNNPKGGLEEEELELNFKFVQAVKGESKCKISLVLDKSGSMNEHNKLSKMNSGVQNLIRYTLKSGTQIGLAEFGSRGFNKCSLTKITDDKSRTDFIKNCVDFQMHGMTCIGCGLLKGLEILNENNNEKGSRIILLTDGAQNQGKGPTDPSVLKALDNANVFVDTISFTAEADENMMKIAKRYHGNYYYESNNPNSNSLNDAFAKNPCDDVEDEETDDIPLVSSAGTINSETLKAFVNIDVSVGKDTKFIFDYRESGTGENGAGILVMLINPDSSKNYTEGSAEYSVDGTFKKIVISIPGNADEGKWTYTILKQTIKQTDKQSYMVTILSKARDSAGKPSPLIIHATVKSTGVTYPSPMVIYR
jgi:calcium-activated chloride channel regulator 4